MVTSGSTVLMDVFPVMMVVVMVVVMMMDRRLRAGLGIGVRRVRIAVARRRIGVISATTLGGLRVVLRRLWVALGRHRGHLGVARRHSAGHSAGHLASAPHHPHHLHHLEHLHAAHQHLHAAHQHLHSAELLHGIEAWHTARAHQGIDAAHHGEGSTTSEWVTKTHIHAAGHHVDSVHRAHPPTSFMGTLSRRKGTKYRINLLNYSQRVGPFPMRSSWTLIPGPSGCREAPPQIGAGVLEPPPELRHSGSG